MVNARIYFRRKGKKKSAVINISGNLDELKMDNGDQLIVRVEDEGTKIVMKAEKSIKI
jgi:hypothetical protein